MLNYLNNVNAQDLAKAFGLTQTITPTRRGFLKLSGGAGLGLVVGFGVSGRLTSPAQAAPTPHPFVEITPDGLVHVISKHLDKGQGSATGLATLVADEMDASIEQVRSKFAPANAALYKNLAFGVQGTGGSTAMANSFLQYRQAGAAARLALVKAAASEWKVPEREIEVSGGVVSHASGRSSGFGELANLAATQTLPEKLTLKTPEQWAYIGKSFPRVDVANKSNGAPRTYGMDFKIDNMIYAMVARPPRWGATFKSMNAASAKSVKGFIEARPGPTGVVVFAESTWAAKQARDAIEIEWDFSKSENRGSDQLYSEYRTLSEQKGPIAHSHGDADVALDNAVKTIEATYEFPYLAHAPMEPLDITIHAKADEVQIWTGSQLQTVDQMVVGGVLGLKPEQVKIDTLWAGGSFGRRAVYNAEYSAEAALVSKVWGKSQPIKIVWTREDDIKGGYYRPMYIHKVKAGVDGAGQLSGWHHRIVGQSIFTGTNFESFVVKDGIDHSSYEGTGDTTYSISDMTVELHSPKVAVPTLWWRSVGHSHTAYVMETMVDQLAELAGRDAVEFRLAMLDKDPRKAGVLKLAAEKAGWGSPMPAGHGRGVAVHKSFNSYVAEVAEVQMQDDGTVKVLKVTVAVDCGIPINPDNIRAQIEGGIGYGLGAVLRNEITLTNGEVDQANFDTYEPLRMDDMPDIEVHIVASTEAPTGIGEPGTPPIGPAVANAIRAASGKSPVRLPFTKEGFA